MSYLRSHLAGKLWGLLSAAVLVVGCADHQEVEPGSMQSEIKIAEENRSRVFGAEASTGRVDFEATAAWTASVAAPADEWCRLSASKGEAGPVRLRLEVDANTSQEERNATIFLECGPSRETVVITQKEANALTVTKTKYEVGPEGGEVLVEVKTNVSSFKYVIDVEACSWIIDRTTRSMEAATLRFRVEPYEGEELRRGGIRILAGDGLVERVEIYQEGSGPCMILTQEEYVVSSEQKTIMVELRSNVDYEVKIPEAGWITDISTRVMSSHTHFFVVSENEEVWDRTAEIIFVNRLTGYTQKVSVLQKGKNAILVAKTTYEVLNEGGYVNFYVCYNTGEFLLDIPVHWIQRVEREESRAMESEEVLLNVDAYDCNDCRSAVIRLLDGDANELGKVTINQSPSGAVVLPEDTYEVSAAGGSLILPMKSNTDFTIDKSTSEWIHFIETRSEYKDYFLVLEIDPNETMKQRTGSFGIKTASDLTIVTIMQAAENDIVLAANRYEVPEEGGILEMEVERNISYSVDLSENWITQISDRTRTIDQLKFEVAPNPTGKLRKATITFNAMDGTVSQSVPVYQVSEGTVVLSGQDMLISDQGGEVAVDIRSGLEVTVSEPDATWLHRMETPASAQPILHYEADPNETYNSRTAKIVVRDVATGNEESVRFVQVQRDAFVLAESVYRMKPEGGTLEFDVQTNAPLEVEIEPGAQSWLAYLETRAMETRTLRFEVAPAEVEREGLITIRCGSAKQTISVLQGLSDNFESIERKALTALYDAASGKSWKQSSNWCTDAPLGEWSGVNVANGRVISLSLPGNSLDGELPDEIGNLTKLEYLDLSQNNLSGKLPDALFRLGNLKTLRLAYNRFSDKLPEEIGQLSQLTELDISENDFTGWFPLSISELTSMQVLKARRNYLSGILSYIISNMPKLRVIDLAANRLTGSLPDALYDMSELTQLDLQMNHLSGGISEALGNLTGLEVLNLNSNKLTGIIPSSISRLTKLHILSLGSNLLQGSLPRSLDDLTNLNTLDLGGNSLSGELTLDFGKLNQLVSLNLKQNYFSGPLPAALTGHVCWPACWINVVDQLGSGFEISKTDLPAPQFTVIDINGQTISSEELYASNELTVLLQWQLGNTESSTILSELKELYNTYKSYGLNVIGYAYDPIIEAMEYVKKNHVTWHTVLCGMNERNEVFRVPSFPAVNVVDRRGNLVFNSFTGKPQEALEYIKSRVSTLQPYTSTNYSANGNVTMLQRASKGNGIDVVLMGDAFSDRQIKDGSYDAVMKKITEYFFTEEPFTSLRECFNVYAVQVVSKNEGYFSGSQSAIGGYFDTGSLVGGNNDICKEFALRIPGMTPEKLNQTLIIVMMNSNKYAGTSYLSFGAEGYGSGLSICYFPLGSDDQTLAQLLHHEANGHGFGKLADEYSSGSGTVMPQSEIASYRSQAAYGWWANVDFVSDPATVKWSRFLSDSRYKNEGLGVYSGACTYASGAYRPTRSSIMRDNLGGFNAPSREAIYKRIMRLAYGMEWKYDYETFVNWDAPSRSRASMLRKQAETPRDFRPLPSPVVLYDSPQPNR